MNREIAAVSGPVAVAKLIILGDGWSCRYTTGPSTAEVRYAAPKLTTSRGSQFGSMPRAQHEQVSSALSIRCSISALSLLLDEIPPWIRASSGIPGQLGKGEGAKPLGG